MFLDFNLVWLFDGVLYVYCVDGVENGNQLSNNQLQDSVILIQF